MKHTRRQYFPLPMETHRTVNFVILWWSGSTTVSCPVLTDCLPRNHYLRYSWSIMAVAGALFVSLVFCVRSTSAFQSTFLGGANSGTQQRQALQKRCAHFADRGSAKDTISTCFAFVGTVHQTLTMHLFSAERHGLYSQALPIAWFSCRAEAFSLYKLSSTCSFL